MGRGHLPCSLRHSVLVTHLVALFFSCHCCCCRYYVSCAHTVPAFDRFQRANLTLSLPRCRRCFGTFVLVRVCPLESLSGWGGRGGGCWHLLLSAGFLYRCTFMPFSFFSFSRSFSFFSASASKLCGKLDKPLQ